MKNDIDFKTKLGNKVDDIVEIFSPLKAMRRRYFRSISKKMFKSYRGAESTRLNSSWVPNGYSADQDLLTDLGTLRERSRDLVRNDGIASGAINTIVINIIGSGIRPQSRVDKEALKINEDYADKLQRQIEKIWDIWATYADAGNRMNFYEIEELSERARFINGESILIPVRRERKNCPYSLALQTIESDRLDTPNDLKSDKNIRTGIELGIYGEPKAYWIRKTHPGDINYTPRAISGNTQSFYNKYLALTDQGAPNIFHLYHVLRSGQSRGEPFFAPVISLFKDRFEYMESELVAARVAACFAVFIKKENAAEAALGRSTTDTDDNHIEELSPALIEYLNPGESVETFAPNRGGGPFGLFMERILRDIASGLNIPYEILSKDFSKSNYSNTRAALLEARRFFMMQQRFICDKLGQPILEMLLEEAYLKGELPILDFYANRAAYVRSRWISPGWQWVDPQNEVAASVEAVNNNLSTLAEEAATQGRDWEEDLEQRARELKKIKELEEKNGIKLTPAPAPAKGPVPGSKQVPAKEPPAAEDNQPQPGDSSEQSAAQ